ncbi:ORF90R [black bullhead herpesvirus]|uniref:ORF90L n=1 Tax=black bullhead herpesvirus TaxID=508441 RepID=A0A2H5AJE4_9VIRU|nr:ORF90L [black bullhead herpesvirus]YP_009447910.1 ORF90R [black bullhead herpesvirus]AUG72262.1 ORF90L [black bullhead herpesvirus]AUG72332.1 ORF90R [black bullhead herpesvirus]
MAGLATAGHTGVVIQAVMKALVFIMVMIILLGAGIALGDETSGDFGGSGSTSTPTTTAPVTKRGSEGTSTSTVDPHAKGVNFHYLRERARNQPPTLSKDPTMDALLKTLVTIKKQTDLTVQTVLAIRSRLEEQGVMTGGARRLPQARRVPRLGYPDPQLTIEGDDPIGDLVALHSCLNHIGTQQKLHEELPMLIKKVDALIDRAEEASNSGLLVSGVLIVVMIALAAIVMVFLLITSSRDRRGAGYSTAPTPHI